MRARRSVRPVRALAGFLLASALALAGCGAGDSDGSASGKGAGSAARQEKDGAGLSGDGKGAGGSAGARYGGAKATGSPQLTTSRIVRTASLTVQVDDVPKALAAARADVLAAGGYVGDETTTRDGDDEERTRVVLRVPTGAFDTVLAGLAGTGRLLDRTVKAEDVTGQVVDVDSRIRSQRASVARVRALMDRATRIDDVVTLEGELSRRQADLEALLARQASLKDRTSLATITLSLSRTPVRPAAHDEEPGFGDALAGGWHVFVTVVRWLVLALGAVLPFAVTAALAVVLWRKVVRPRLPRRPAASDPAVPGPFPMVAPAPRVAPEPSGPGTAEPGEHR
ncbi:DUF4349 domain-containing protein [Streptomyces sp. NPDC046831]|uniref:DUF4349 domain-containing protein n=1 Tax=Streptomyces sp. NPDC046831 TaxID=3154805 RepID=UPI0033EE1BD0